MNKIVLSLFDHSTIMVRPWADAGYRCLCVDLQHPDGEWTDGNITVIGANILDFLPPIAEYAIAFAFPPCTHLAVSGARWFKGKGLGALADSVKLFDRAAMICEWTQSPYMIENPVSTISSYWREPDYTFQPFEYGDPWTKKTCLWTGNGFVMPEKTPVEPILGGKIHKMVPGPDRARLRSLTPEGFARAVFNANHKTE